MEEPFVITCPDPCNLKNKGGLGVYDFEFESLYDEEIPTSLTKEVATIKKIRRMKTMSINGETLISVCSALRLIRFFLIYFLKLPKKQNGHPFWLPIQVL